MSTPQNAKPKFSSKVLLVIEDNPDHLFLIQSALQESMPGIKAVAVRGTKDAIDHLKNAVANRGVDLPDLILADLYLPSRLEGLATLESLREFFLAQQFTKIPVVVFSYSSDQEDIDDCYRLGANAYIVKSDNYGEWVEYFATLRDFWLETVSLPQFGW